MVNCVPLSCTLKRPQKTLQREKLSSQVPRHLIYIYIYMKTNSEKDEETCVSAPRLHSHAPGNGFRCLAPENISPMCLAHTPGYLAHVSCGPRLDFVTFLWQNPKF